MATFVRDVMMTNPLSVDAEASIRQAAEVMRDNDIGDVLVVGDGSLRGILTDRDIVVRALAEGRQPEATPVGDVCSPKLAVVEAEAEVDKAAELMRRHAIRRLPVVDSDEVVGIVTLGDLARRGDAESALSDISAAPPNA
ncbi:MAG TPA: CBS domain-containing protein [Acidimicrobiales bacterium]|nr:CBS domain-containing protein [Acidimicrobiales bacterium]